MVAYDFPKSMVTYLLLKLQHILRIRVEEFY